MSRADYLEQAMRGNASPSMTRESAAISPDDIWTVDNAHPLIIQELEPVHQAKTTVVELATTSLSVTTLETVRDQVLLQLKLGKQAPGYKAALKALNHFIAALTS